jgi:fructosamine-3-kinase
MNSHSPLWSAIAETITAAIDENFGEYSYQPVGGGCINQTYRLQNHSYRFFVKVNGADRVEMLRSEFIALKEMQKTRTIAVPTPLCLGATDQYSFLVLEWLDLRNSHQDQDWALMGKHIAQLHKCTSTKGFGWDRDNTIGSTPQINSWHRDWVSFWIENRLKPQLQLAKQKGYYPKVATKHLWEAVPKLFRDYLPTPSLVHGDLWSGNLSFCEGVPVIYDPALYYGDREVDIAMTELFGRLPKQFYDSYNQHLPLDRGYVQRRSLYNLYHILNHYNLFGGIYAFQADNLMAEVVALC